MIYTLKALGSNQYMMHFDRVMIIGIYASDAPREPSEQVTRGVDGYDGKAMVRGSARGLEIVCSMR